MTTTPQHTIRRPVEVHGVCFFSGNDATIRFEPAPAGHGIAFQRTDLPGTPPIPATLAFAVPRQRRTALARGEAVVELTEHVLAALAGLAVHNCRVLLDGPEVPGMDGSAAPFADALLEAGRADLQQPRRTLTVDREVTVYAPDGSSLTARPPTRPGLWIDYQLDYGHAAPVPPQRVEVEVHPETFADQLAPARTFVLEREVEALRRQGYGSRTTARDLLAFRDDGTIVDNALRFDDECPRHKILDCLGDLALLGCDLHARIEARRSGHQLNRDLASQLEAASNGGRPHTRRSAA